MQTIDNNAMWSLTEKRVSFGAESRNWSRFTAVILVVIISNFGVVHAQDATSVLTEEQQALERARTSHDRSRQAQVLQSLGSLCESSGKAKLAVDYDKEAAAIYGELGDRQNEAVTLVALGRADSEAGKPQEGFERTNEALVIARHLKNRQVEIEALIGDGQIDNDLMLFSKAIAAFEQALKLTDRSIHQETRSSLLRGLGIAYTSNQPHRALSLLNQAFSIDHTLGDRRSEASSLTAIGEVYDRIGNLESSLAFYNRSLPLSREVCDVRGEAVTLIDIGANYDVKGDRPKAFEYYSQALKLEQSLGNRGDEAAVLSNLGGVEKATGRIEEALDSYNKALTIQQELGNRNGTALAMHGIANADQELGEQDKALDLLNEALAIEKELGEQKEQALTIGNIAGAEKDKGEPQKALASFHKALAIQSAIGDTPDEAQTLINIGAVYLDLHDTQSARQYLTRARPIAQHASSRLAEAYALWGLGLLEDAKSLEDYLNALRIAKDLSEIELQAQICSSLMSHFQKEKQPPAAIFFGKQSVNYLQKIRGNITSLPPEMQSSFVQSKADTYRALAKLLVENGQIPEAEHVIGMLKSEEYSEFLRGGEGQQAETQQLSVTDSESTAAKITAQELMWIKLKALGNKRSEAEQNQFAALDKSRTESNEAFADKLQRILGNTDTQKTAREKSSNMQNILRDLETTSPNTVGVYTLVQEKELDLILITRNVKIAYTVPIERAVLNTKVEEFRKQLQDPCSDPREAAHDFYKLLIDPMLSELNGSHPKTIVWELDGALRYIPIAALYDGNQYLAASYNTVLFSANNQSAMTAPLSVSEWKALGMGTSKKHGDLEPLITVPKELEGIIRDAADSASIGPVPGTILLDESFTPQAMKNALDTGYPIVHIASHFVLSPGSDQSYLVVGAGDPGRLSGDRLTYSELRDEYSFSGVQLMTLSACETGTGGGKREEDGKEIDALADLAEGNGAKSVMATLWSVSDVSTGQFMVDFYKRWTVGGSTLKVQALSDAQVEMLRNGVPDTTRKACNASSQPLTLRHPFYWAPFILVGNWQ